MLNKKQQIEHSFIHFIPILTSMLLSFITMPIFTRILTKEDYGILALANIYTSFLAGVSNFGLIIIYERNFFQYRDTKGASELLYSILFFVFGSFFLCGFFTYLFRDTFAKWIIGSKVYGNLLFWNFCACGMMHFKTYYLSYFKNSENAKSLVWYTIMDSILVLIGSLFLVAYLRIGIMGMVWGQLIAHIVILAILTGKFLAFLPVSFNWKILKEALTLSYPLTPRIFLKVTGSQSDKFIIGLMANHGGVGIYSIGQKISYLVFTFMTAIENVFSPQVYKRMFDLGEKGKESIGRYLTPFAYISIAFGLIISLFCEEMMSVLTPRSYHGAIDIVIVLSLYYGSLFFAKQPQLIFAKKTHITSFLTIFSVGLTILLNIPFIIKWGAIGAAWATLISGLVFCIIFFIVSQRYYTIKWEYGKIGAIYIMFYVSSLITILLRYYTVAYHIRFIVKLFLSGYYTYLGVKFNIITKENYLVIKNMVLSKFTRKVQFT